LAYGCSVPSRLNRSDRFRTVQHAVEDSRRHTQAFIAFVEGAQLSEGGIGRARDRGKPVEKRKLVVLQRLAGADHGPPDIPGQHLHIVERGDIAHKVAGNKPEPVHGENAECRRIGLTRAALRPGIARDDEAIAWHIEQVEIRVQLRPLKFVDLRVNENPTRFRGIPIFADLMVLEVTAIEIGTETAPSPGRNTFGAQHGDEEHCEVTADTDEARTNWPTDGKRLAVMGEKVIKHPLRGADM
jgi:hypothetical protein